VLYSAKPFHLSQSTGIYQPPLLKVHVCEDPDGDNYFACALASDSKIIISRDKYLLGFQDIRALKF
jgi:hypothetical protein